MSIRYVYKLWLNTRYRTLYHQQHAVLPATHVLITMSLTKMNVSCYVCVHFSDMLPMQLELKQSLYYNTVHGLINDLSSY